MNRICWLIYCCFALPALSIAQQYNFKNFSFEEGLTESNISTVCDDKDGNLWVGTLGGGLFKYDGYDFTSYHTENGLINNFIHSIYQEPSGKMWIGTEDGICVFDGKRFQYLPLFDQLKGNRINAIAGIPLLNEIWFATDENGLYRLKDNKFTQYNSRRNVPDSQINCLLFDQKNILWIGTKNGVVKFARNQFTTYQQNDGLPGNNITAITKDQKGNIWFGTANKGISKYDKRRFRNYNRNNGIASNQIQALYSDYRGNLWIGTKRGISKYQDNVFSVFNEAAGQTGNTITSIYGDKTGNIWFGTNGRGLEKLDSERFVHFSENDVLGKRVYSMVQGVSGNKIFATSRGGITFYDSGQYSIIKGTKGFTDSQVKSLYYSEDSSLWIGTTGDGAYQFNQKRFTKYSTADGLNSNDVNGFVADDLGNIWIATADSGLSILPILKDSLSVFQKLTLDNGLVSNRINTMSKDLKGNLWVGSEDAGLSRITPEKEGDTLRFLIKHFGIRDGLNHESIKAILIDEQNHLFIGTAGGGLNIFDGKEFRQITKADGLMSNNIYSLVFDRQGNIWAGTERGVTRITLAPDLTAASINHYGTAEGFKGVEVYKNASMVDDLGNIWFGTVNGIVKYNPKEDQIIEAIPTIQLTGMKLFFDNIEDTPYADSVASNYPIPDELTLPFDQNNLSFQYSGTYLRNPEGVQYKWKLDGFNDQWSPALSSREAIFSNLPPGSYTFWVNSGNEYGNWNEKPASFKFKILPPPWKQWWVMPSAVTLLVFVISSIIYQRFRRVKAKNRVVQERLMMEKSIIELEQEASRLQMNPHFIFNSLNSIQGFIATNDPFQAKRYLAKFARLMRLILENAREEYIPLQNEVDILENYLELEKLSTNHKFDYSIEIAASIEPEITEIPPMMIQPFVENAIIHGVKKKEGQGRIDLDFIVKDGKVICEIVDNGIGREATQKAKAGIKKNHKSTGILVTKKRLEQYNLQTGLQLGVSIIDLKSEEKAIGTKVVISMPYEGD